MNMAEIHKLGDNDSIFHVFLCSMHVIANIPKI